MLQQWERERWLVYHLVTYSLTATGAQSYTVGPGGQIDNTYQYAWSLSALGISAKGAGYAINDTVNLAGGSPNTQAQIKVTSVDGGGGITGLAISIAGLYPAALPTTFTAGSTSGAGLGATFTTPTWVIGNSVPGSGVRPSKLESAFLRQITQSQPNQIDYPMEILQSREDYNRIALKSLVSFPGYAWLDTAWPLAQLYFWPVPNASIYSLNITVREQLPPSFLTQAVVLNLPYEYYAAMVYNLAVRLAAKYRIPFGPGDPLPAMAKDALAVLRGTNAQIAELMLPKMDRPFLYNIFSDRFY